MEAAIECTHCGVVMTAWSAPGSPIRYYQCPFCSRTHSSLYGEVFRLRAGARARVLDAPSAEDARWARVKARAARWFARLEADERRAGPRAVARPRRASPAPDVPEVDPGDVVEVAPAAASRRR
jgi:hypothetical protein